MKVIEAVKNQGHGALTPKYLFIHETANPGATAANHSKLYATGYKYAVQYVCDWTGDVYHCVPDNRLAWGVGNGNRYGVNLEICHAKNKDDFKKAWDTAVAFVAWYLKQRGWTIANLMSHNECRLKWGGTTHTDPVGYFQKYGKTFEEFKQEVKKKMEANATTTSKPAATTKPATTTTATKPATDTMKTGSYRTTANLNVRVGAGTNFRRKTKKELTLNARLHAKDNGVLKSGTKVTVKEVKVNGNYTWGKIPSGWICLKAGKTTYVKKV